MGGREGRKKEEEGGREGGEENRGKEGGWRG